MARHRWLIFLFALILAGCFHDPTPQQRAESFQGLEIARVQNVALKDFLALRSAYLLGTATGEFATDRPGHLILTDILDSMHELRLYTGTAVVLTRDGYMLTAAHCAAAKKLVVIPAIEDGHATLGPLKPRIVWLGSAGDPVMDVALLKVEATLPAAFEWAEDAEVQHHTPVSLAGIDFTPTHMGFSYAAGRILDADWMEERRGGPPIHAITHDAPVRRGDSGGPLLTPEGHLAGINVAVRYGIGPQFSVALRPEPTWIRWLIERDREMQREKRGGEAGAPVEMTKSEIRMTNQ